MADKISSHIIDDILERLAALEAAVHASGAHSVGDRRLTKPQVALREGCSPRTVDRRVEEQKLPPPDDIISGRPHWWLSTLERHDRERLREARKVWPAAKGQSDAAKA